MSALLEHLDAIMVSLRPRADFRPVPPTQEREAWQGVRQRTAEACVRGAERYLGLEWPTITATEVMLSSMMGDPKRFKPKYDGRRAALAALALGEAVEGKGRFLADIIDLSFMICEETAWTLPENLMRPDGTPEGLPDVERPQLDLGAARTGALLATTLYLHREKLREASPLITMRMEREITMRVIDPYVNSNGVCFMRVPGEVDPLPEGVKECLTALLLTEREDRYRWKGVKKSMQLLDAYLDSLPQDGGIPGGVGAFEGGVGCLMESLELISEASGGNTSFFTISALRRMGEFLIGSHINLDYFNCSGDCPAHLRADAPLIYRCGVLLRSEDVRALGAYLMRLQEGGEGYRSLPLLRAARAVMGEGEMLRHDARPPMPMDYYLRSGALMCVRSRTGSPDGFFASLEGGVNRPGGHADAGNMTLFWNGEPVLPDLGEIAYASSMTPDERAALWETQSQYHNLPVINDRAQCLGERYQAVEPIGELTPERSRATLDISRAYPDDAGVIAWQRTVSLMRGEQPCVHMWEIAEFERDENDIEFNFITTRRPYVRVNGVELGDILMEWDGECKLACDVQELPPRHARQYDPEQLYDKWLLELCGRPLYRMVLMLKGAPRRLSVCFTFTHRDA